MQFFIKHMLAQLRYGSYATKVGCVSVHSHYGLTLFSCMALARDGEGQSQYDKVIHVRQDTPVPIEGRWLPMDVDRLSG